MSDVAIVVVGDALSHGGVVVTGSPFDTIAGNAVARMGDLARCDRHGMTRIAEGSLHHRSGGLPVALHHHRCECGCLLIAAGAAALSRISA